MNSSCAPLAMAQRPTSEEHRRPDVLELEERYRRAGGDSIEHQRARTSWAGQRADGANPTLDGFIAGSKYGLLSTLLGLAVVGAATVGSRRFRESSSPGGRAWLVCTFGMAGFFINSEMAVVGTEAREHAAGRVAVQPVGDPERGSSCKSTGV